MLSQPNQPINQPNNQLTQISQHKQPAHRPPGSNRTLPVPALQTCCSAALLRFARNSSHTKPETNLSGQIAGAPHHVVVAWGRRIRSQQLPQAPQRRQQHRPKSGAVCVRNEFNQRGEYNTVLPEPAAACSQGSAGKYSSNHPSKPFQSWYGKSPAIGDGYQLCCSANWARQDQ